ncbi:MAG: TonB-dependent receptor, partial [Kofleriaceae bacterium]|nr:TonB-dependent receptor [Kofleriaceae bacterium]
ASDTQRPSASGNRQGLRVALSEEVEVVEGKLFVDLGLRADILRTLPSRDVFSQGTSASAAVQRDWYLSPRATVRYRVADDVALKASGGRYLRIPTLVEMFGDRGFILGNPELRPEVGLTGDLGIVWAPNSKNSFIDRIYSEAAIFVSRPENPIVFLTGNGFVSQARNLDGARILGSELVASARFWKRVTVTGNYSFLDPRKRSDDLSNDKILPGRPENRFFMRVDSAFEPRGRLLVLWADALRVSGNFLDELNSLELPPRTLLGCGIKAAVMRDLTLSLEVKNLLNVRSEDVALSPSPSPDLTRTPLPLSDVHGFPLPGRSIYLNLQWAL